jgi:hypothetical protein
MCMIYAGLPSERIKCGIKFPQPKQHKTIKSSLLMHKVSITNQIQINSNDKDGSEVFYFL